MPSLRIEYHKETHMGEVGDGRFILSRRCVGVTPHLCISSALFYEGDLSSPALIKARVREKTQEIRVIEPAIVKESGVALGTEHSRRK